MRNFSFILTFAIAFALGACGGGSSHFFPTGGDMAMSNTGTPDLSMTTTPPDLTMTQAPQDFSMPEPTPDLSMPKMYKYGCNGLIGCTNNCAGDQTCNKTCQMNASPASLKLFNNVITCVFVQACPTANGGVCDSTAMGYVQANCDNCLMKAQAMGGQCYTPLQTCIADKP